MSTVVTKNHSIEDVTPFVDVAIQGAVTTAGKVTENTVTRIIELYLVKMRKEGVEISESDIPRISVSVYGAVFRQSVLRGYHFHFNEFASVSRYVRAETCRRPPATGKIVKVPSRYALRIKPQSSFEKSVVGTKKSKGRK